jgi:hypothetical protein
MQSIGEVDFWIIWIFNFLQLAIDWTNNSKTKVEKVVFFIFMSSYAEMILLKKNSLNRAQIFFEIGQYEVQKILNFTLICFLSLYLAPVKS